MSDAPHFSLTCSGKRPYPTRGQAERAARALNRRKGGKPATAYACGECGGWHFGRWRTLSRPRARVKTRLVEA